MIELTEKRKARLLGALLHDIGKFQYRAEKTKVGHSENSAYFIREFLGRIESVKPFLEDIIRFAGDHHTEYADDSLREADGMSASERVKDDHYFAHRPLLSVFQMIDIGKGGPPSGSWFVKPGALNISNIFPEHENAEPKNWKPDVKAMRDLHKESWEKMKDEFQNLPQSISFEVLYDMIYALMERWTSRVCSAGYGFTPDISLFDHSRIVAAYADCLAECDDKEKPFLIIEGDVSGIQSFIYKIANPSDADQKKASKILRGRSLYVNLLSDSAADFLLKELGLFKVHLLMNGGGHFHILAPNSEKLRAKINELEIRINRWLIEEHHGELGLVIATMEFLSAEIVDYSRVKRKISALLSQKKEKKNFNLLGIFNFFGPHEPGATRENWDVCKICGGDMKRNQSRICPVCNSHLIVGENLPKSKYLLKIHADHFPPQSNYPTLKMDGLKSAWVFAEGVSELREIILDYPSAEYIEVNTINETDFADRYLLSLQNDFSDKKIMLGFRFIGKWTPQEQGKTMSFEELANQGDGYPLLHILRMDVDNLGQIFAFGLKGGEYVEEKKYYSISRLASLSREMDLYFSGYLNKLAEKHQIYITYSGGDDLFVVGKWNNAIHFAMNVKEDFARFTCHNPNLSISGGAFLTHPNFPIRRAAELAGKEELRAKNSPRSDKNAFALFEQVYAWNRIKELVEWSENMVELIKTEEYKYRGLIRYLKDIRDQFIIDGKIVDPDWLVKVRHKIFYILTRRAEMGNREMKKMDKNSLKMKTLGNLITDPKLLEDIQIPSVYSLLQTRKQSS